VTSIYYHGTSESSALSLKRDGIVPDELQRFDRGYYGVGLYVSESFLHAKHYGRSVLSLTMPVGTREFDASGLVKANTGPLASRQADTPSWYDEFYSTYLSQFSGEERELVKSRITPESGGYERDVEYAAVTEYAKGQGFDIVNWSQHENIIVNYDLDFTIEPESKQAKSAFKTAEKEGEL